MLLIGLSAKMACGKTTTAKFLQENIRKRGKTCEILPFAQPLKEECSELYRFPLEWTKTGKDKTVNVPDWAPYSPNWSGQPTVREILQYYGTEVCRAKEPGIWVRKFLEKAEQLGADVIICDDVRFPDEAEPFMKKGLCFRIEAYPGYEPKSFHSSETSLDDYEFHRRFYPKFGESHLRHVANEILVLAKLKASPKVAP